MRSRACTAALYVTQHDQYQNYQQYESDTAARTITPATAITPGWNRTHERKQQHDQKNGSQSHFGSPHLRFPWFYYCYFPQLSLFVDEHREEAKGESDSNRDDYSPR